MANGEPSFTVTLVTLNKRSSFCKSAALAASTTPVVTGVTVAGIFAVGLAAVNKVPVPSSFMVATPVAV